MIVLGLLVLAALVGPYLLPYAYDQVNKNDVWAAAADRRATCSAPTRWAATCWRGC